MQGTLELLQHHRTVYAVDTEAQEARIRTRVDECAKSRRFGGFLTIEQFAASRLLVDAAYLVNVLHTLPSARRRVSLLRLVRDHLKETGMMLVDVPSYEHYYSSRMTAANARGDGYVFEHGGTIRTFYRFTTGEELDRWAHRAGLQFEERLIDNHHMVRTYRPVS